ncbi:MAG: hypothetical protein JRC77_03465 [Deltaproteobacteria bacterium]|nr:hypothetical protein [Deltaproteobacteria bacterium]
MIRPKQLTKNPVFYGSKPFGCPFSASHCLFFACYTILWTLLLTSVAGSTTRAAITDSPSSDSSIASEIQKALELQESLLEQVTDEGELGSPESKHLETQGSIDLRRTPAVPLERMIPESLFEEEAIVIPKGYWPDTKEANPKELRVLRLSLDADNDGKPEQIRYLDPATRFRIRMEEDRNYDGRLDAWSSYAAALATATSESPLQHRLLDDNEDGLADRWELYEADHMATLEIDRDGDGRVDLRMSYKIDFIDKEEHDTNGDGQMDRFVSYRKGQRHKVLEDRNHNGQVDTWITYRSINGKELVAHIAMDKENRGKPNYFETYAPRSDGSSTLKLREEDLDYDGEINITSFYENGKLKRRQIKETTPGKKP